MSQQPGRHRRSRTERLRILQNVALAAVLAVGVVAVFTSDDPPVRTAACRPVALRVVASPDIAPVLSRLAAHTNATATAGSAGCHVRVTVTGQDSAQASRQIGAASDVWIPDSSVWVAQLPARIRPAAQRWASLAHTPVVLAVSRPTAPGTSFASLAASDLTVRPALWSFPDPSGSSVGVAAVLGLRNAVLRAADRDTVLAAVVRNAAGTVPLDVLTRPQAQPYAIATTEQSVWAFAAAHPTAAVRAVYPPAPAAALDYPFVVTTTDAARVDAAERWLRELQNPSGVAAMQAAGFRSASGTAGRTVVTSPAVDAAVAIRADAPTASERAVAVSLVDTLSEPSRTLAVVDVSGSMATPVPGRHGKTRLDVARDVALRAVALFPAQNVVGLWEFSTDLTPTHDYRQLAAPTVLGPTTRGALSAAIAQLAVKPNGETGLYDTVLAAVRTMRASYDTARINSVIVLSDGANYDPHGITLRTLLTTLHEEDDPRRPVPVITIAYGPDADAATMGAISTATRGAAFRSFDPNDLPQVFLAALGQRLCRPNCRTAG